MTEKVERKSAEERDAERLADMDPQERASEQAKRDLEALPADERREIKEAQRLARERAHFIASFKEVASADDGKRYVVHFDFLELSDRSKAERKKVVKAVLRSLEKRILDDLNV